MKKSKIFTSGIFTSNPIFVLFLGMCPVLATTSSFSTAFGMGLAVTAVLMLTNILISAIRKLVPNEVRIPVYIVVIATVVTIIEMIMKAFTPDLAATLGIYLSIIVVNCIILGRAEAFASKNSVLDSFLDGIGTGLGFLAGLLIISLLREVIGTGALKFQEPFANTVLFNIRLFPQDYAISLFTQNAGAFLMLGLVAASINALKGPIQRFKDKQAQKKLAKVAAKPATNA